VQKSIEVLMGEHRLIQQVLGSLETYALAVGGGLAAERGAVADYAAFFRGFADTCHHGKEEDILFQRMMERGFSRDTGPLAVMYYEHDAGRRHVRELAELGSAPGVFAEPERRRLVVAAESFVPLLRATSSRRTGSSTRWRCGS
jgi:hemerythrin-like domain-containing protein